MRSNADVLRHAAEILWSGKGVFSGRITCCNAIMMATTDESQRELLLNTIIGRLDGCLTLRSWLIYKCGVPAAHTTPKNIQAHRKAWLRLLADEFEGKQ